MTDSQSFLGTPEKLQNESQRFLSTSTLLAKGSMQHRTQRASVHPYTPPTFECAFSGHPPETLFLLSWRLARYRYSGFQLEFGVESPAAFWGARLGWAGSRPKSRLKSLLLSPDLLSQIH